MITVYEHKGYVKRIKGEFNVTEWLTIVKALNWFICYYNHSDDAQIAKSILDMMHQFVEEGE